VRSFPNTHLVVFVSGSGLFAHPIISSRPDLRSTTVFNLGHIFWRRFNLLIIRKPVFICAQPGAAGHGLTTRLHFDHSLSPQSVCTCTAGSTFSRLGLLALYTWDRLCHPHGYVDTIYRGLYSFPSIWPHLLLEAFHPSDIMRLQYDWYICWPRGLLSSHEWRESCRRFVQGLYR
jgi:hypothetical protein